MPGTSAFFGALLGWRLTAPEPGSGPGAVHAEGVHIGGVSDLSAPVYPPGLPDNVAFYIGVGDADAMTARAEAAGAHVVVPPFDAGGLGRVATLIDPVGAAFSLWEGRAFRGWTEPARTLLACADPERAASFYARLAGSGEPGRAPRGP
ncbi:VOC family protein [Nocardiopsis coralliicola]